MSLPKLLRNISMVLKTSNKWDSPGYEIVQCRYEGSSETSVWFSRQVTKDSGGHDFYVIRTFPDLLTTVRKTSISLKGSYKLFQTNTRCSNSEHHTLRQTLLSGVRVRVVCYPYLLGLIQKHFVSSMCYRGNQYVHCPTQILVSV
jgi:hypothetical protein